MTIEDDRQRRRTARPMLGHRSSAILLPDRLVLRDQTYRPSVIVGTSSDPVVALVYVNSVEDPKQQSRLYCPMTLTRPIVRSITMMSAVVMAMIIEQIATSQGYIG